MSSLVGNIPPWLEPAPRAGFPTRELESAALRFALHVPEGWGDPAEQELPTHRELLVRGPSAAAGLLVQLLEGADPAADLQGWAGAPLALTGAPAVALALGDGAPPETLDWRLVEASGSLLDRFRVDEIHLFEGLVRSGSTMSRIYTVLARREATAWHLGLALETDVAPDAPRELVERSDHVRAGATLGRLRLG